MTLLSCKILVNSFSKWVEYTARKSNISFIPLTLSPEYKLFTPILKSAYLSLLNTVLADIVPGKQTFPSMMNHPLFTSSSTLMSGLLAPFLGCFSRCHGISTELLLFHSPCTVLGGSAYTTVERVEIHRIRIFPINCGTEVVAFDRACPCTASVLFWSSHIEYGVLFLDR